MTVTQPSHLVGHFNSHLRDCVFRFDNEAFFAGDRAHNRVLRACREISDPPTPRLQAMLRHNFGWHGAFISRRALKRILTEKTLEIEGKGQNVIVAPNFLLEAVMNLWQV